MFLIDMAQDAAVTINANELMVAAYQFALVLFIAVIAFFLKRTGSVLDKVVADVAKINIEVFPGFDKRLSIMEILVEQHDASLDVLGLEKIVRRRYADEIQRTPVAAAEQKFPVINMRDDTP